MLYNEPSDRDGPPATRLAVAAAASDPSSASARASDLARTAALAVMAAQVAAMRAALLGSEKARIEECMLGLERAGNAFRETFQISGFEEEALGLDHRLTTTFALPSRLRRDLKALRHDLAVIGGLAQSGAALYQGMARLLGAAAGGYTPQGDGAPLQPSVSVLVRG